MTSRLSVRGRITLTASAFAAVALAGISLLIIGLVERDVQRTATDALDRALSEQAASLGSIDGPVGDDVQQTSFDLVADGKTYELGLFDELSGGNASGELLVDGVLTAVLEIDLDSNEVVGVRDPVTGAPVDDADVEREVSELTFAMLEVPVDGEPGRSTLLVGATARADIEASTAAVRRALMVTVPLALMAFALMTWWALGRAFRPVTTMARRVGDISTSSLDQRVPVPAGNDEVVELATVMNAMLDRLERGDERQRAFAADASHELRSPLTTIRAAAELIARRPDDPRADVLAADVVAEADRMETLIDDLLELARSDAPGVDGRPIVDLRAIARDVVAAAVPTGVAIELVGASAAPVRGDAAQLARAIRNLVDNARRHARSEVHVEVHVDGAGAGAGDLVVVRVDDDGEGVPVADRERVFERFTRLDAGRSRDEGGAGLGLSLVRAIVAGHHGSVVIDSSPLGGAAVIVSLPRGPDERSGVQSSGRA